MAEKPPAAAEEPAVAQEEPASAPQEPSAPPEEPATLPQTPRPASILLVEKTQGTLFADDFEDGSADGWALVGNWEVRSEGDNRFLVGSGPEASARPLADGWSDYRLAVRFRSTGDWFLLNLRESRYAGHIRYILEVGPDGCILSKQIGTDLFHLVRGSRSPELNRWHALEARLEGNNIKVYLDGVLELDYTDREIPILTGTFSLDRVTKTSVSFDDVVVTGTRLVQSPKWVKTGGPSGGLGYDVRIHPESPDIMFVTDNPSGVNKSYDGGSTWVQRNDGITARGGASGDGIPIFCLTIDPNDPRIVWTGTQSMRGVFKSTDGGETWVKKDNGIVEWDEIAFRGFAVRPGKSDVVFAGAEIATGILGREFDRAKGKIYKTKDGGETWRCVWEGGSLARIILFDPTNPDVMYASTGIFDREAYNIIGVGVLKSTDGGETWKQASNGLEHLFIGFLEMHPRDRLTLFAAAGRIGSTPSERCGVYMTANGGDSWIRLLESEEPMTVVTVSPSDPAVIYAGSGCAFYRSDDGGRTWQRYAKEEENCYGPPGVRAGYPISAVVHPDDPMTVYANNYAGGVFKSTDGAQTWVDWSVGYTGAELNDIAQDPRNPQVVYANGRNCPFRSSDGGRTWQGLGFSPASFSEWITVAVNPKNPRELLIAEEHQGTLLRSTNQGRSWTVVFHHPGASGQPAERHGLKAIAYAPSDPLVVYAGMRKDKRTVDGGFPWAPSLGIFKSTDGGRSWTEANNGLGQTGKNINDIAVHPLTPDIAYAATWGDGVFKTTDGGKSWTAVNAGLFSLDVRSLAVDSTNPDVVYAGLAEGVGIFKTSNGGELWEPINAGIKVECPSFLQRVGQVQVGVSLEKPKRIRTGEYYSIPWTNIEAIVIDPVEPQRIYAADVSRGVYVSTDGGESWVPINEGLTTKAVSALSISPDGRVLYAATRGAGVFSLTLW